MTDKVGVYQESFEKTSDKSYCRWDWEAGDWGLGTDKRDAINRRLYKEFIHQLFIDRLLGN
ncbi:hypothetical protein FD723_19930 [Nostoc sp. C052]|uniref:hypothetical protein n=1 Tax=Nostoc sp. C052 TaxID=2576902 RepID=UPI0015C2FA33|nr:hypothetical protein [Nostoc sp. C052]QLE42475.1 hypothetical protein FD723_19930 [Nostoc sp. C052]